MFGYLGLALLEEYLKYFTINLDALILETVHVPKKLIAEYEIGEYLECLNFAHNNRQHNNWIRHALHIADIRSQQMEYLQYFLHFRTENFLIILSHRTSTVDRMPTGAPVEDYIHFVAEGTHDVAVYLRFYVGFDLVAIAPL